MAEKLSLYIVTDTHYYDSSFKRTGPAYERRSVTDQKCVAETPAIIDAGFAKIAQDKETDIILIPGDLVYRGEYQSQVGFRERLYKLKQQGKKIYVITAGHDFSDSPVEFVGEELVPVEGMPREELWDFYKDFGFGDTVSEHRESMSYVAQLADGIRLLALNCDGDLDKFHGITEDEMKWAVDEIKKAHEQGEYIFAMMHYPLLPYSAVMNLIGNAKVSNWEKTATTLANAGLELIFTGHMHSQALTQFTTKEGNTITDVQTGCFVGCPCAYRKVTFNDGNVHIKSYTIEDFDYDKNEMTAEEYFRWRFDRMILWKIEKTLPKAACKIIDKLTVKKLNRLLFIRADRETESRLVKDVMIELVRNIFVGNEPYVKGTPMYEEIEKLLKRVRPVTFFAEKKLGKKDPVLSDITTFILSMIGDEEQRDYEAVLPISFRL